jgi:hypothetical protein
MRRPSIYSRLGVLLALCLGFLCDAAALSCSPIKTRYIFQCDTEHCSAAFSVRDVHTSGACSRRPQVEVIGPGVVVQAAGLVDAVRPPAARGLYELTMAKPYWTGDENDPHAWFKDNAISAVTLLQDDASAEAVAGLRRTYESDARAAYWKSILFSCVFWSSAVIALLALIASVRMFFARLHSTPRKLRHLLAPMGIQLVVLLAGMMMALFAMTGLFWPGLLLVPVVPVILACEGGAWLMKMLAEKRAVGPSKKG